MLQSMGSQESDRTEATELNCISVSLHSEKMDDDKRVNIGINVDLSLRSDAIKCCVMLRK